MSGDVRGPNEHKPGEYEPGMPEWGFLYLAFTGRSSDTDHIAVFEAEPERPHDTLNRFLLETGA